MCPQIVLFALVAVASAGVVVPVVPVAHSSSSIVRTSVVHGHPVVAAPLVHAPVVPVVRHAPLVHAAPVVPVVRHAPLVHAPVVPVVRHAPVVVPVAHAAPVLIH